MKHTKLIREESHRELELKDKKRSCNAELDEKKEIRKGKEREIKATLKLNTKFDLKLTYYLVL